MGTDHRGNSIANNAAAKTNAERAGREVSKPIVFTNAMKDRIDAPSPKKKDEQNNNQTPKANKQRQIKIYEVDESGKKLGFRAKMKAKKDERNQYQTPKEKVGSKPPIVFTDVMKDRIDITDTDAKK